MQHPIDATWREDIYFVIPLCMGIMVLFDCANSWQDPMYLLSMSEMLLRTCVFHITCTEIYPRFIRGKLSVPIERFLKLIVVLVWIMVDVYVSAWHINYDHKPVHASTKMMGRGILLAGLYALFFT